MTIKRVLAVAGVALVAFAACGDDETPTSTAEGPTSAPPVEESPQRIVSMSPTATEMLFAIDAGDQVVAADSNSNYPKAAPTTDLSAYEPNVEAIAGYEPDIVVISDDIRNLEQQLEKLDIDVVVAPAAATINDVYDQIEQFGELTGHEEEAAALEESMRAEIKTLTSELPSRDLAYYHELDDTLYTVTSETFIGQLYAMAGLENVADPADAKGQSGGYPQLSAEYLVDADPDLVFLADTKCCGQDAGTFADRPGFADLTAVQEGNVVELDDDIASRWGPRIVDLLGQIVGAVEAVPSR